MLVSMNQVLKSAVDRQCCIGAFDTPSLEILMAVLGAAEKRNEPVIVQHAQLHECEIPIDVIGPIMVRMADDSRMRDAGPRGGHCLCEKSPVPWIQRRDD